MRNCRERTKLSKKRNWRAATLEGSYKESQPSDGCGGGGGGEGVSGTERRALRLAGYAIYVKFQ